MVETTASLEKLIPPGIVTVMFSPLGFVAVTPSPTKSNEIAAVDKLEPSSFTVIALPPPSPIDAERSVIF